MCQAQLHRRSHKFKTLTLKGLFGTYRAKRAVYSDASAAINSDAFKAALENQLIWLPALLLQIAEHIYHKGPRRLSWSDYSYQVVVCPRGLVRQHYVNSVVTALENSAELSDFVGLPAAFLERTASTAEGEWFLLREVFESSLRTWRASAVYCPPRFSQAPALSRLVVR